MLTSQVRLDWCTRLLAAAGYPPVPAALVDPRGWRRFVRRWGARAPGAQADLEALFSLLDAEVVLDIRAESAGSWALQVPPGKALLGMLPPRRRAVIHASWKRHDLLTYLPALIHWCSTVARHWLSLEWDEARVWHGWQDGFAVGTAAAAATEFYRAVEGPALFFRRAAAATLAVLSVHGAPQLHEAGTLIVAEPTLRLVLVNAEPFVPAWAATPGRRPASAATWTALRPLHHLDVLVDDVAAQPSWNLNGRPRPAQRLCPGVFRLSLEGRVDVGTPVRIGARDRRDGRRLAVYPNPVVFESGARVEEGAAAASFSWHRPGPLGRSFAAHTFETLLAGSADVTRVVQPHPIASTLADAFAELTRHHDVCRHLGRVFPGLPEVDVRVAVRWEPGADASLRRVLVVRLAPGPDDAITPAVLARAARRQLAARLPTTLTLSIETPETHHEHRPSQPPHPDPVLSRRIRRRRAEGLAR